MGWYRKNHRKLPWRETSDPYSIWVSEVMLQQTQVNTVLSYYMQFLERFPSVTHLAESDLNEVLKAWELLGYYARARNLHRSARMVVDEHQARFPGNYEDIRKLPGVGDYIAAAVSSIAFNEPRAVLDGNVKRVLSRLFLVDLPVNNQKSNGPYQDLAGELLDQQQPGTFNQAIMELGATVCKPAVPLCPECPVKSLCKAFRQKKQNSYPKKIKKPKVPQYRIAVGVVKKADKFLITRRPAEGLLGGLWEFPGGKIAAGESPEDACSREIREEVNLTVTVQKSIGQVNHAYTHFKVNIEAFLCNHPAGKVKLNGPVDYRWVRHEELNDYPFPAATHKIIKLLA